MSLPKPRIHVHNHHSSQGTSLISLLQAQLPYSGPLLRRIQYDRRLNPTSSTSAICLATFPPGTNPCSPSEKCDGDDGTPTSPWLAAYVDIHSWPETQVWMYSSLEPWSTDFQNSDGKSSFSQIGISPAVVAENHAQLLLLLSYIRTELVPTYLRSLEIDNKLATSTAVPKPPAKGNVVSQIPPHPRTAVLTGSLHSGLLELLNTATPTIPTLQTASFPKVHVSRTSHPPYVKYLFTSSEYTASRHNAKLPPGYRFHDRYGRHGYQLRHWDLLMSRTHIPRSKERLAAMASAVIYRDDQSTPADLDEAEDPIAWGFLGLDGSLMLLHVEPEHRGRGLAVLVGQEVMRIGMMGESAVFEVREGEEEEEERWVFADVALDNTASRRVMEKMGGQPAWTLGWVVTEVCIGGECHCCAEIGSHPTVRQGS